MENAQDYFFKTNNVLHILSFPFSVALIVLATIYIQNTQKNFLLAAGVVDYTKSSLSIAPILDIQATYNQCPDGYHLISLGIWPGALDGCPDGSGNAQIDCDYYSIQGMSSLEITRWRDNSFCIKRQSKFELPVDGQCNGLKKCGQVCVSADSSCPITGIEVTYDPSYGDNQEVINFSNRFMRLTRNEDNPPLSFLQFAYYSRPCLSVGYVAEPQEVYPLIKHRYGCGLYGLDEQSTVIDSLPEIELYRQNGYWIALSELNNYYKVIQNSKVTLVTRERIEYNDVDVCSKLNMGNIAYYSVESLVEGQYKWMVLIMVFETVLVTTTLAFALLMTMKEMRILIIETFCLFNMMSFPAFSIMGFCFSLVANAFASESVQDILSNKGDYLAFKEHNCFSNSKINQAFEDYGQFVNEIPLQLESTIHWMFLISLIRLVIEGIVFTNKKNLP